MWRNGCICDERIWLFFRLYVPLSKKDEKVHGYNGGDDSGDVLRVEGDR
jgi:hypothetical protein